MKTLFVVFACAALAACGSAIRLSNPQTGQTVECGPYALDAIGSNSQAMRESRCIDDYQRQGFVRVP